MWEGPRTYCAAARRRSSACGSGGTAVSTCARTRFRKPCSPPPPCGRSTALPEEPVARLVTVVGRKLTELWRSEHAGRQREKTVAAADVAAQGHALPADIGLLSTPPDAPIDDTLELLLLGAHHALSEPSQIALTLRAVGGLTTEEIARAFLVPEATVAQRRPSTPRAATFTLPDHDRVERLAAARHVLYLVFNEGYPVSAGWTLTRAPFGC